MLTPSSLLAKLQPYIDGLVALGKFDLHVQAETHRANQLEIESERLRAVVRDQKNDIQYLLEWRDKDGPSACGLPDDELVLCKFNASDPYVCRAKNLPKTCRWRPLELPEGGERG